MDLKTASAVLNQQMNDAMNMFQNMNVLSFTLSSLVNQENSIPDINAQVKALMGTANINMQSIVAQNILIQQTIDAISGLVG